MSGLDLKGWISQHGVRSGKSKAGNRRPDWRGATTIDGKEYWVSGWTEEKYGKEIVTLRYTPKEDLA